MTAFAYYYLSLFMVVLAVVSNKYWRRQLTKVDEQYVEAKKNAEDVSKKVSVVAAECMALGNDLAALTKRANKAEQEHEHFTAELEKRKHAPVTRYYVFERVQPRPGAFWEVAVRCVTEGAPEQTGRNTWAGIRSYMLIADNEGAALRRAQSRFSPQNGYQVVQAAPSRVAGLSISRVEELSTFRRSSSSSKEMAEAS